VRLNGGRKFCPARAGLPFDFTLRLRTGGAAIGAGLSATSAAAAGKMPQKAVSYQSTPKGKQRCDNCSLWQPPGSCKLVQDPIDPAGWCVLYKAKA